VKYDRPVWQIMHACADAMPETFRYEEVRGWFRTHYPDVNEATIRAHLIGLTEGGRAKPVQFAQRSPVFRRVARGEYAPIPLADRGESPTGATPSASRLKIDGAPDRPASSVQVEQRVPPSAEQGGRVGTSAPTGDTATAPAAPEDDAPAESSESDDDPPTTQQPDIILLGSVGERVNVPAPAKEVFREMSFQLARLEAEVSGSDWFVLSAEHGLLGPNEWLSPDSRTLADMDPDYRVTWASWVVARLESMVGSLDQMLVRVNAPNEFIGPLFTHLQDAGAVVSSGSVGLSLPPTVARRGPSDSPSAGLHGVPADAPEEDAHEDVDLDDEADADIVTLDQRSPASLHLADLRHAVPAADVSSLPTSSGLYGWFVDPAGARDLNRSLMLPVRAGLIFVGQVGGSSWQALADPVLNLRDHVERIQLHGRVRASTFRMTLATVLRDHLRMTSLEDPVLTTWMLRHLSVSAWSCDNFGALRELEQVVVGELDPPLNVDHLPASEYRARLSQMRSALA
jgi:hypothetical protein